MKFTTPAMASEPYTAPAPSFSTSTRSMRLTGIMLMSAASLCAEEADAAAVQQHQRALGTEAAQLDVGFAGAAAVVHCRIGGGAGNCRQSLQQITCVVTPDFSMEALSMVTIGLADSVSSRRTREPVTMTSSIDSVASWSCSCAIAFCMLSCDSEAVAAVASAKRTEFVSEEFDIFRLLNGYRSTVQRCACPTPSPTVYFL